jgi:hypothetical protein
MSSRPHASEERRISLAYVEIVIGDLQLFPHMFYRVVIRAKPQSSPLKRSHDCQGHHPFTSSDTSGDMHLLLKLQIADIPKSVEQKKQFNKFYLTTVTDKLYLNVKYIFYN